MSISGRRLLRGLPATALGAVAVAALGAPSFTVLGHRGAWRVAEGFREGLWDARFRVARQPAALRLPPHPMRLSLLLSGPATLRLAAAGNEATRRLTAQPSEIDLALPGGGTVALDADATIRLHAIRVRRGPPLWGRMQAVLATALAGALLAIRGRGGRAMALSLALASGGAVVALHGTLGALCLATLWDRLAPSLALLAVAVAALALSRLPGPQRTGTDVGGRWPLIFAGASLASCLAQVLLLAQPLPIGDPASYLEIGQRFREGLASIRGPDSLADAIQALRPYGGLALLGALYGGLLGLYDGLVTLYVAHALAMACAVGWLTRAALRLGGRGLGILTGALAAAFPSFAVICGIVQPEPFILLAWCWSFDRLLVARERDDLRGLALAGLAFAVGLALHPQGMWVLLGALGLLLLPLAPRLRLRATRLGAGAFALGLLPLAMLTAIGETYARPVVSVLDQRHGFFAYTARFPLGFWLFIDTDGWQGPHRIDDTRFARGFLQVEAEGRLAGPVDRIRYTASFAAANWQASTRTVLRNLHRLWHVPDNPFRLDWGLSYSWQVRLHRSLVVFFLLGVPLPLAGRGAGLLAPFALLSMTYPCYHIFNKYGVVAYPFLLLGASMAILKLARERPRWLLAAIGAAGAATLVAPADLALRGVAPSLARMLVEGTHLVGLAVAFGLVWREWASSSAQRLATAIAATVVLAPTLAVSWGNPGWRAFSLGLDARPRHAVALGEGDRARLDTAREAYLVLDLQVPSGDPSALRLHFDGGLVLPGVSLQPCMPGYGLATVRGGRAPRTFRQWWRVPWQPDMARGDRVGVEIEGPEGTWLFGDLVMPQDGDLRRGLSFGEWPHASVYRLMHDGEYRLAAEYRLSGGQPVSTVGGWRLPGRLGVHLLILDEDVGGTVWETAPAPAAEVVTAIWAQAGRSVRADLILPACSLRLDFEDPRTIVDPAAELRVVPTAEYEGWFLLRTRAVPGAPLRLQVRPLQEMSAVPKYFLPELRDEPPPFPEDWRHFPYLPPLRVIESRRAPPWQIRDVF